ncbi:hypothetical protein [Actinosynnema sp. NPDC020468]|uniref:hypothetical protein n=1 Tax=Actinosynnema sp. NPDC020468 TaxID=3154488 RepID=UPI0033E7DB9A
MSTMSAKARAAFHPTVLAVLLTAVGAPAAVAAPADVEPGSAPFSSYVRKDDDHDGRVSGTVSWDGRGGYTIDGTASASCARSFVGVRYTAWLEYGGTSQSWKKSSTEGECSDTYETGTAPVHAEGTLAKGEKLEIRVSSWISWSINPYAAGPRQVFTIS